MNITTGSFMMEHLLLTSCTVLSRDQRRIWPGFSPSLWSDRLLSRICSHLATLSGSLISSLTWQKEFFFLSHCSVYWLQH